MSDQIHPAVFIGQKQLYQRLNYQFHSLIIEPESKDYNACSFKLNNLSVKFRSAKITPKKVGQFVSIWKRDNDGSTTPFDTTDLFNLLIINTRDGDKFGQIIFPKSVLAKQGIISINGKIGKCGIRVYSPWSITSNPQAKKTQKWQSAYFLAIPLDEHIDQSFAQMLLNSI